MTVPQIEALTEAWHKWSSSPDFPFAKSRSRGYCINATRTGIDALAAYGVKAKPVSVSMVIANQAASQLIEAGVPFTEWPEHAWSIGLGHDNATSPDAGWNGHLVIEVGNYYVIDLSGEALHRPGLIEIDGPIVLAGLARVGQETHYTLDRSVVVFAQRTPEHNAWRHAPGWTTRRPLDTAELIRRMALELT
jgi:hypothetical protein